MKKFKFFLFLILSLNGFHILQAQTMAGSPYTVFGVGDRYNKGFGKNRALGGSGIGLRDGYSLNNLNPASYTAISAPFTELTQFGLAVTVGEHQGVEESSSNTSFSFPGLAMWFRTSSASAISIGLVPYSKVGYSLSTQQSFSGVPGKYGVSYEGSGGLSQVYLGAGYELFKNFSLGANLSYIFGPITEEQTIAASEYVDNLAIEKNLFLNTFNLDLGMQYSIPVGKSTFTLGAVYDYKNSLNGSYKVSIQEVSSDATTLLEENTQSESSYILPTSYGGGISWNYNNKWILTTDYSTEKWGEADFQDGYSLRDSERYSAGFSILPNRRGNSYMQRVGWDFGGFHEKTYLVLEGNGIGRNGFSLGVNLPISTTIVGLSFEQSFRAPEQSQSLISEQYSQITLNLSFLDLWFGKTKYD